MLHRTRARLRAVASVVVAALIAVPVVALSPVSPVSPLSAAPSASAAAPLMCDQNTIYGVSGSGQVRSIDATTGAMSGDITDFPQVSSDNGINALGITNNGLDAYAFDRGGRVLHYDPVGGTQDVLAATGITATEAAGVIRGAVNPVNGIFYFGVGSASAGLWAFDTRNDRMIGRVGTINGLLETTPNGNPANGDFAFSSQGLLFVVTGDRIMRVVETLPITTGNQQLSTRLVADLEDDVNSPGIAFTQDGYLFVSSGTNMSKLDPVTGDRVGTPFRIGDGSFSPTDLASCNYPNTITVQKDLGGRVQAGDQFALSITGGGIQAGNTATTTGSATGIQSERAGAVLTVPNASYTVTETAAGTANLANYTSSLQCVNINNPSTPIVYTNRTATSATFTFPAAQQGVPDGTDVVCTFSNQPIAAGLTLTKSADPASGTTVQAGQTVTYTVRATNTGSQTMTAQVRDDLTRVLSRGQLVGTPIATIDGVPAAGTTTVSGRTLTWSGQLAGTKTVELSYTVRLAANAVGGSIDNTATATGTIPNRPTLTARPATTSHPVATPGFTIAKSASPASGSAVEPGQLVTYSVTGANTGQTSLAAVVSDDLADLLAVGAIEGTPSATIAGAPTTAPTVTGNELRWTGSLAPGQSVVVTYAIRIDADAPSGTLDNVATGSATPPGGTTITPPAATTTHPLQSSGFTLVKTATPATGTAVEPGATVAYAVTGTNDGDTSLSAVVTDDLADVLAHATLQDAPTATIDGEPAVAPTLDGTTLRWQGTLAPGQVVRLAYTVVVDGDAGGQTLVNGATATATSPGGTRIDAPEVSTTHPVLMPGFAFTKVSTPGNGTAVDPGATIAYTLTGANTGQTRLVDVTVTDDLSDVLDDADVAVQPVARIGDDVVTAPTIVDGILTWTGDLAVDESVVITYSVVVRGDTGGATIGNSATGSATPPGGGTPIEPEPETTTHPVLTPGFAFAKTSTPGSGSAVDPGATVAYALTGANTGETALRDVTIADDLSDVLDDATISVAPEARIGGELADEQPVVDGTTLTWTGDLAVGETVVVTYSVLVGGDAGGATLANVATASATPPGGSTPIEPNPGTTTHDVNEPGFTLAKTADPESGTAVDPGATIAYTLTGANTGETALAPVTIVDDLSDVLDDATISADPEARIGDETVDAPVLDGTTLTWTGELAVGETVVITYSVVVGGDAGGSVIANGATASATPPGDGTPLVPEPVDTTHDVNEPGFDLTKTVEPGSGTAIDPGATLAYTVTGSNVGETPLDPVVITDDLSDVLDDARMSIDPEARIGGELAEAQPVVDGTTLTWTGRLAVGEDVVITYSVVVTGDAGGNVIGNTATGSATPPGGGTPITPDEVDDTSNQVNRPGFALAKTADPASGAAVDAASVVTYTITGTNTGETALDPVSIDDDLSGVLDDATITTAPTATIAGEPATAPVVDGTTLTWSGRLEVGQAVTIVYAVTVDADAGGSLLENSATASATPPGGATPLVPEPARTTNPVNLPGFSLTKAADPVSGTAVDPGDVVTYALTGTNTGETALTDVTIVDDLSQVLAHADLGELGASIGGEPVEPPVLDGTTLTWTGDLAVGETVVVTYDVTVHADAGGATLGNAVTGSATPPGGIAIVPPTSTTEHPVNEPGFALAKSADPESGSAVDPGTTVTYTVTGANTGETVLETVVIDDDLTEVLAGADLVGEPVATIGDEPVDAPVVDGTMLTWTGALQVGETVTLVYQVVVHEGAGGTVLRNHASAIATPPGGLELVPAPVETEHDVNESGFTLDKTADHGAIVAVGDVIHFAVTATNTGETTLDVDVVDDLSAVLAGATLDGAPTATVGDAPVVDGDTIRWSGTLAPGEQVVIAYSVTVQADGAGLTLRNVATARASGPGGDITPPPATTETRVQPPLPRTGAEVAAPIAAVALLLMLAGAALAIRRRREA